MSRRPRDGFKRWWAFLFAFFCWIVSAVPSVHADTLWLKSGEKLTGLVVAQSDDGYTFQIWKGAQRSVSKNDIEILVRTHDSSRLSKLSPDDLGLYQRYVEELSPQDPVSRQLAIRLTVIVGWRSQPGGSQYRWALSQLEKLARTRQESRKVEALKLLNSTRTSTRDTGPKMIRPKNIKSYRLLLQLVRQERTTEAKKLWNQLKGKELPDLLIQWVSKPELSQLVESGPLTPQQLLRVLELDQQLDSSNFQNKGSRIDWANESQVIFSGWDEIPNFSNVTEFDPRQTIYRQGSWFEDK